MSEQPLLDASSDKVITLAQETQFAPKGIVSRTLRGQQFSMLLTLFKPSQGQSALPGLNCQSPITKRQ
jgi:hypothetical protein